MRINFVRLVCMSVALTSIFQLIAQEQGPAIISIDLQKEKAPVSPGLYGIFLEEIHHAFDGGLYAELIRNRSFEDGLVPPGMKLVSRPDGGLKMELESLPAGVPKEKWEMPWPWNGNCDWDPENALRGWSMRDPSDSSAIRLSTRHPLNKANTLSLELDLGKSKGQRGELCLINEGYWGIPVGKGIDYDLNFYLRPGSFKGKIIVALEDENEQVLASHCFNDFGSHGEWEKKTCKLSAQGSAPDAKLTLTFKGKGQLQIDYVSLFPPTFKNRENGLRPDLANYLADLQPDFVRYPGGCYVQGLSWESAPDWRKMVCPPEERPGNWGYWKYRSTDGFGYHEFLQFCEDIDADAMYVSFAGMTVHPENNWPLKDIDTIIQQTVDAIEYALGPTDSKWGSLRASMGHPEPFPLKYIEIGNEHPPAIYGDYYVRFREAIKEKYPDLTVIMSMFWSGLNQEAIERAGEGNIDMVDEHAYRNADWIRSNFDYFDKYERTPWSIYVGEYASHHRTGNLYAGLSDAVYLMMLERNGDLVKMASYAPLFVNVNEPSWNVNLIEFNAAQSFAHASYYVQKVFNENRPDVNLETTSMNFPRADTGRIILGGRVGLGSWRTSTEFKDLKIHNGEGDLLLSEDFVDLDHWEQLREGRWNTNDGVLIQEDSLVGPTMLLLKEPVISTGSITLKARRIGGEEGFLIFLNVEGRDRFVFCNYGAAGNAFSAVQSWGAPADHAFRGGLSTSGPIANDRWHDIRVDIYKDRVDMYLDGEMISDAYVIPMESVFATAGLMRSGNSVILKAVNYHPEPVEARIVLKGKESAGAMAQQIVISSEEKYDQNTLDAPLKITPSIRMVKAGAKEFGISLPPFSVNLLKIPLENTNIQLNQ